MKNNKIIQFIIYNKGLILFYLLMILFTIIQVNTIEKRDAEISRQKQQNYYIKEIERK